MPLGGKTVAMFGIQLLDTFKNQLSVRRLFAKYEDKRPGNAQDYLRASMTEVLC